ncbi:hypothetical protein [Micromonospora sediminicola]|uniref:hypothetical protein n=1 Tax=Micromonospora sediminicola TaxID=946078 RepID=UPI0037B5BEBD
MRDNHELLRRQERIIDTIGWAVTYVLPTDDGTVTTAPFAYTVGLTAHFTDRPLCDRVFRARAS